MAITRRTTATMTANGRAAQLSIASSFLFLILLSLLHVLKPELEPSWRMISEYEVGAKGWLMQAAFLALAASCVGLALSIRPQVRTRAGRAGLILLCVAAVGMTLAAFATADPITASKGQLTTHGSLHGVGALLGIPVIPVAATLISRSLGRDPAWGEEHRRLRWTAILTWLGLGLFIGTVAATLPAQHGTFGPEVPMGWPNRILILTYVLWLLSAAAAAYRRDRTSR